MNSKIYLEFKNLLERDYRLNEALYAIKLQHNLSNQEYQAIKHKYQLEAMSLANKKMESKNKVKKPKKPRKRKAKQPIQSVIPEVLNPDSSGGEIESIIDKVNDVLDNGVQIKIGIVIDITPKKSRK